MIGTFLPTQTSSRKRVYFIVQYITWNNSGAVPPKLKNPDGSNVISEDGRRSVHKPGNGRMFSTHFQNW